MRRLRWLIAAVCAGVLIAILAGFDALGADCGDAIAKDGGQSFECNTIAYVVMAAGVIALAGLVAMAAWAVIEWIITRRDRAVR